MFRHIRRCVLIGMIVISALVGSVGQLGSTAAAQEPQFSAAASATLIAQAGQIGKVFLPALPTECRQFTAGYLGPVEQVTIEHLANNPISILSVPGVDPQNVRVHLRLYQRLANNKYVFLKEYSSFTTGTVGEFFSFVDVVGKLENLPAGPDYVVAYYVEWLSPSGQSVDGWAIALQSDYYTLLDNKGASALYDQPMCSSLFPPQATLSATSGTVSSPVSYALKNYPLGVSVPIVWDGKVIANASTNSAGVTSGTIPVPAAPMGTHKLSFSYGHWVASKTFTVKPRIKLFPNSGLTRGQTVNVSLRGYAKYETVNIRWKKGTSWITVAQAKTSGTGSANINVKVPSFAVIGTNSVRGDGKYGHAQTNGVTVVASASIASSANASPTPTKTATPTATTAISETVTPEPSPTVAPTEQPSTPEITETATVLPTDTTTPTVEPTEDMGSPTETPTVEPTAVPTETPAATATEGTT
jgi:hypothetical protein